MTRESDRVHRPCPPAAWLRALIAAVTVVGAAGATTGCGSGGTELMPTPNVYASGARDPFPDVPPDLRNNRVDVLYLTDRQPEEPTPAGAAYGFKRSRSIA